jgi:gamma-glutamyltranspeptidase / glutathione hydrolase
MSRAGAITASSEAAVEAGCSILRQGGNAVDAAVATALASCVADGCNIGLGGYGGHMVVAVPTADPMAVDFDMWVPRKSADGYRGRSINGPSASVIPNVVAGLERALSQWGSMDWTAVSAAAIKLAADGVEANETVRAAFELTKGAEFIKECFEFETTSVAGGERFRFRQPALARTLEQMAAAGPGWFYDGPIGDKAVEILRDAGHDVNRTHWRQAPESVIVAPAPRLSFDGTTVFSAPLGTSGSLCMFATAAAGIAVARQQPLETPEAVLAWAQGIASAWGYRFGTPDGNIVADGQLEAWIGRALAFEQPVSIPAGAGHTCHLNALDSNGMIVAMTLTYGPAWFGARWSVPGTGVIMNTGASLLTNVAPQVVGERAYGITNMAPTIVRTDDGAVLAAGCPGARRIPTIVGIVLTRHLFGGLDLQEAVSRGRFHAESRDLATIEAERWSPSLAPALRKEFRDVETEGARDYFGPFTAIRQERSGAVAFGLDDRWPSYHGVGTGHVTAG